MTTASDRLPAVILRSPRARAAALLAALALIEEAERRAKSLRWAPHEAVSAEQFATLAAALRRQAKEQP
jgi:hypothetical protein